MGTRHVVEVIRNKKAVIRQYGQWDGYAETAAYQLRNFIKEKGKDELCEMLDKLVFQNNTTDPNEPDMLITSKSHILESMMTSYDKDVAKYVQEIREMTFRLDDDYIGIIPAVIHKFGFDRALEYYVLTRDTGYRILDALYVFHVIQEYPPYGKDFGNKLPVYLEPEDIDTGRKIIINVDDETFTCKYFGREKSWTFDKLPTLVELRKVDKW